MSNCNFSCRHIQVLSASIDWPCSTLVRGVLKRGDSRAPTNKYVSFFINQGNILVLKCHKIWNTLFTVSQGHLQMSYFVWPTVQNPKIFRLLSLKARKSSKSSHFRRFNQQTLCIFAWKMTELITWSLKIIADTFSVNWAISQTQISLRLNINESHNCHKHTHSVVFLFFLSESHMHRADPGNNNLYVVFNKVTAHPKKAEHCSRQMFWEIILPFF